MHTDFIDRNKKIITILLSFFILLALISFIIITKKYEKIEERINTKNISNLIYKIESRIKFNRKIALNLSSTDEVYDFLENNNENYINSNFRKGSYTLEDLDLSYFILSDKNGNIKFSTYNRAKQNENISDFEQKIINYSKGFNNLNKVIIYQNEAYYLSKTPVYKTDYENNSNGYLYIGSKVDLKDLLSTSSTYKSIKFISNIESSLEKNILNNLQSTSLKTKITRKIENNINYNEISFHDNNSNLIFTVKTESLADITVETKEVLLIIFLSLVISAIFILLYISSRYKKDLEKLHKIVKRKVKKETNELNTRIQELEKANKNLYTIAHTDFLTKTMNRRNFFMHAQNKFNEAKRHDALMSVIMIDIDNFKTFNDKYGHSVGDKVLILFADKIKNLISEKSIFGRLGGEEFAIVVSNTSLEDTISKAEKLKKNIEQIQLTIDSEKVKITASFGVSDNVNCSNIDEMLQQADTHLYSAKESGRNLVRSRLNFC